MSGSLSTILLDLTIHHSRFTSKTPTNSTNTTNTTNTTITTITTIPTFPSWGYLLLRLLY